MEKIEEFLHIDPIRRISCIYEDVFRSEQRSGFGSGSGQGSGFGQGYGYGDGYGYGQGYGYGDEYGDGDGYGYGDGYGDGDGYGYGYGYGYGFGITRFNQYDVYNIDNIQTILTSIKNNIAKGFILNSDLTLTPCYIIKRENMFAHGETIEQANNSLQEKLFESKSPEERITSFKENFQDFSIKIPALELFKWHSILTGSCEMGRKSFCRDKNINLETDSFTIYEFIELTKDSYRGDIIKQLL